MGFTDQGRHVTTGAACDGACLRQHAWGPSGAATLQGIEEVVPDTSENGTGAKER